MINYNEFKLKNFNSTISMKWFLMSSIFPKANSKPVFNIHYETARRILFAQSSVSNENLA